MLFAFGLLMTCGAAAQSQSTAALRVKTDIADVEVWLNGESKGRTPLTLRDLTTGKHRITLLKDGYEDHLQEVEVASGKPNSIFVVMKPRNVKLPDLPVTFKVAHWHRIFRWHNTDSCRGTLTVSADALDYKAENDSDQFHIPIAKINSVARSVGPDVSDMAGPVVRPTDNMAFRIETSGRAYTFMAFKDTRKDAPEIRGEVTRELYEVVFRLWSATLNTPQKSKD